jgi:hypothetical protein
MLRNISYFVKSYGIVDFFQFCDVAQVATTDENI